MRWWILRHVPLLGYYAIYCNRNTNPQAYIAFYRAVFGMLSDPLVNPFGSEAQKGELAELHILDPMVLWENGARNSTLCWKYC